MKNRILLLCLKNKINTTQEFATAVGIDEELALNILEGKCIVPSNVLEQCSKLFGVSVDYLICNE